MYVCTCMYMYLYHCMYIYYVYYTTTHVCMYYILGLNSWYSNDCLCWERSSIFLKFDYMYICSWWPINCMYILGRSNYIYMYNKINFTLFLCSEKSRVSFEVWLHVHLYMYFQFVACTCTWTITLHIQCTIKSMSHMYILSTSPVTSCICLLLRFDVGVFGGFITPAFT